ncbi:MAG: 16S rRNA (guanine(527)-N(7))-methyltransferase RsmG [Candidatus Thiodiazotropha sp. (ex Semelilucina semeliformis)]|nr:16S rRNA (guanine(527)-N(7))-methyltransferase RsmG [Candidatus Thiodiazotropha sp. (ex Semelilucina semeliformis)]
MANHFDESACRERLQQGSETLGLALADEQAEKLLQFLSLLAKWNRAYNLTAVRDPLEMVSRHLLDSLAVEPHLEGRRCLDMGTGPGLPGIPLAVIRPEIEFVLLDSNNKKIRFVRQAILELGLKNVEAVHTRVEDYQPEKGFDMLISRAFTSLPNMLDLTAGLRRIDTVLLAMKATVPQDELQTLEAENNCRIIPLQVPYTEGQRCLIRFSQAG